MNCEQAETLLAAFVFGEVDPPIVHELEEHIERCETCSAALREVRAAAGLLEEALAHAPAPALSPDRREKLAGLKWPKKRKPFWLWRPINLFGSAAAARWHPLVTAAAGVAILVLIAGLFLPALGTAREEARSASSKSNLRQIGTGVNVWLTKRGKDTTYPPSLESLVEDEIMQDDHVFRDPHLATKSKPGEFSSDYESILDKTGGQLRESQVDSSTPLAWERRSGSDDNGRNVVFFDGRVEHMSEGKFQKMMNKTEERFGGIARSDEEYGQGWVGVAKSEEATKSADEPRAPASKSHAAKRDEKGEKSAAEGEKDGQIVRRGDRERQGTRFRDVTVLAARGRRFKSNEAKGEPGGEDGAFAKDPDAARTDGSYAWSAVAARNRAGAKAPAGGIMTVVNVPEGGTVMIGGLAEAPADKPAAGPAGPGKYLGKSGIVIISDGVGSGVEKGLDADLDAYKKDDKSERAWKPLYRDERDDKRHGRVGTWIADIIVLEVQPSVDKSRSLTLGPRRDVKTAGDKRTKEVPATALPKRPRGPHPPEAEPKVLTGSLAITKKQAEEATEQQEGGKPKKAHK